MLNKSREEISVFQNQLNDSYNWKKLAVNFFICLCGKRNHLKNLFLM